MATDSLIARGILTDTDETRAATQRDCFEVVDLAAVPIGPWADLMARSVEPNAFFHPDWARAVDRHANGKGGTRALLAWDTPARRTLTGLLPVVSAWRSTKLPIPVMVAWGAYAPVSVPLLDRDRPEQAARGLLQAASAAGAQALLLPFMTSTGPAADAMRQATQHAGVSRFRQMRDHRRARLDASVECDAMLREALGPKKLKELRRQRSRMNDDGEVSFEVARTPADVARALEGFLRLEDSGWKGARGTALIRDAGDAAFIRAAMTGLAATGHAEIVTLARGSETLAAGLVLRHRDSSYFFKIAYDEALAKTSPGVQLTLELTRHICADPSISGMDSIAVADHPMIDHIWRDRLDIADLLVPTAPDAPGLPLFAALFEARHQARGVARRALHTIRTIRSR